MIDQQGFEQQTKERREKAVESLTLDALRTMLEQNVQFFDTHYIKNRAIQIMQETIKGLNFKSETIEAARRAFLDVLLAGAREHVFTLEDEIRETKKQLKDAPKSEKGRIADRLSSLERKRDNLPRDLTEERDIKCEPTAQLVVRTILSPELFLKDQEYITRAIEFDDELLLTVNAMNYLEAAFNGIYDSLDQSYLKCNDKHWGCPREKITMKQLDQTLKS